MEFASEWVPGENLWETRYYGKYDGVSYVRTFLGHDQVYVPILQVLVFETLPGCYRANSFLKQAMDAIHYNQIEIIAYDSGSLGDKAEYREILKQCGYEYINKIALASEFGMRHMGYFFFHKMIEVYNPERKKYGMISNQVNLFAKRNNLDFLFYMSPDRYPHRYYFGRNQLPQERFFEKFVNEQLFQGNMEESRGYHFGYVFEGIFVDSFCRFIRDQKEQKKIDTLYFPVCAESICQSYSLLYPEDQVEILYADRRTKRDVGLIIYLNQTICKNSGVVDFSINENFGKYVKENMEIPTEVWNLNSFFSPKVIKNCQDEINRAVAMAEDHSFYVKAYEHRRAVWEEDEANIRNLRNHQEIHRGIMDFVRQFDEYSEKRFYKSSAHQIFSQNFIGRVLQYAFDERKRAQSHPDLSYMLMKSSLIKKVYRKLKKIKRKIGVK